MRLWLREAALAVVGAYGRFPVPRVQVLIVPVQERRWGQDEAVPFGHVLRGGGPAIEFFVNTERPLKEYLLDWTAVHELSHLLHPLLVSEDSWLSEGFASYYQNILRARNGVLSRRAAWQKLHEGFQRGIKGTRGLPLTEAAEQMHRNRAYMRVYWSGAAVALMADVWLRTNEHGSLDEALARFADCCLPAQRRWRGAEFMAKLDELMQTGIFTDLYTRYAQARTFPDLTREYELLGLNAEGKRLRLVTAEHSPTREQITHSHSNSL
jgi:hypothetical protein